MAKNTATNLYNHIISTYTLNNYFYFATSPCKRAIQTLYYFQQVFSNAGNLGYYKNTSFNYDIFPNIQEGFILDKNISKGIYDNYKNNYSKLNGSDSFEKYCNNADWNFCNSYYLNNVNYNFYDTLIIYLEWKRMI
jgi:hypothetical protein